MSPTSIRAEMERVGALCATGLLDTLPEERFDRLTRLAAQFFKVPIALVSLVDERRQWFKSRYGLEVAETPRSQAFCAHAIEGRDTMIVEDAQLDPRFSLNPLVTGGPLIRFYAGHPIFSHEGFALGTLCVIDTKPRTFSDDEAKALRDFSALVEEEFTKVAISRDAVSTSNALVSAEAKFQATFEQAAVGIAHVGLDGTFSKVNTKFSEIVGRQSGELEKLSFQEITHPADLNLDLKLFNEMLAGDRLWYSIEKRYIHSDSRDIWVNLTVSLVRITSGEPAYFISVIEDIQEKKANEFALRALNEELEQRVQNRTRELETIVEQLGYEVVNRSRVEEELRYSEAHTRTILQASHDAFVGIDESGMIISWNQAAEQTFGWTADEAIGANLTATIIPAEHHSAHKDGMEAYLKSGQGTVINRRIELPARTKSGRVIPVELTISPYQINDKNYFGAFLHDISERREAARTLEQKQQLLDAVLASVDVGVVACNADGEITLFNRAAAIFHGVQPSSVPAHDWAKAFDLYDADGITPLATAQIPLYRAMMGEVVEHAEMTIVPKGRLPRFVFASGKRLVGSDGQHLGAVVAMNDVTALKNLERQRAENEERLRAITENLPAMIGHVDENMRFSFLNGHALRFYGRERHELIGKGLDAIYSAEEYEVVRPYIESARSGTRASFESQMEMQGVTRHFSAMYIPEQTGKASPVGFYAMAMDITGRKKSELQHVEIAERLKTITDNLPVLIAYIDQDEVYRFANLTYERWFGISPAMMVGKTVLEVLGGELYELGKNNLRENLLGHATRIETSYVAEGDVRIVEVVGIPHLKDGVPLGVYVMTTDITAVKHQEALLQNLARSDTLTGLPNRRSYEEKLEEAALRCARSGRALCLVYLDIDLFKKINDSLGHSGGDAVLKEFAQRLKASVRATDIVSRLAGDEFTIILEGTANAYEAGAVATKILAAMTAPFIVNGQAFSVSTSLGIACQSSSNIDTDSLSEQADSALYRAKASGRSTFAFYEDRSDI